MRRNFPKAGGLWGALILGCCWFGLANALAAESATVQDAKRKAEAQGHLFLTSHDEIVARARTEGKLRVLSGLSPESMKAMSEAFRRRYPFIEFSAEELTGVDAQQRILLELKGGVDKGWDVISIGNDLYNEYQPYHKKFDILGMAQQRILQIPLQMIDPTNRNIVAVTSNVQVGVAYNNRLLSADQTPSTWEDYLKPQFKGRKFLADVRPTEIAALVPAWGLEKTLDFARRLAAQEPVWVRGGTRALTAMAAGEYALFIGTNYKTIRRAHLKDLTRSIGYKFLEPVPVRFSESIGVVTPSRHPHAALLWLEFQAGAEGQKIIDENDPFGASIYGPGSIQGQEIRGKQLSSVDWHHYTKLGQYQDKVVAAYGFPKVQTKK